MTIEDLKRHWQDEAVQAERIGEWCWTCDKAAVDTCVEGKHNFVQPGTTPLEVAERRVVELEGAVTSVLDKLFNDGRREGWLGIQQSAVDELRAALAKGEQP